MKQPIQKILTLCFAALIFFVGAGFTVVDFCCSGCIEEQFFTQSHAGSCCQSADNQTKNDSHHCATDGVKHTEHSKCTNPHEGECCVSERVSFDLDNRISKIDLNNSFVSTFVHCYCCCFCHTEDITESFPGYNYLDTEPIPPRDYLSLIRVLII